MPPAAIVFDAYGTLFDVHSVIAQAGAGIAGDVRALSQLWRQKQVEHTWRRTLMGQYRDFWQVTKEALQASAQQVSIGLDQAQVDALMHAYLSPAAFPEVRPALEKMKASRLAILSNGSPAMLESAVRASRLESYFANVISVDSIEAYKPLPAVYALAEKALGVRAAETLFVSANLWDAAGAKAYGYRVCWCDRTGSAMNPPIDALGFAPDFIAARLDQIPTW